MSAIPPLTADDDGACTQGEKVFDLRLVLGMLSFTQIRKFVIEAERRCLPHVVSALNDYLSQRGRGRPRHDKYAEIDAWLIVWANEFFRSGQVSSAWAAITRAVEGAWAAWDDGTRSGRRVAEVLIGNNIWRAPIGETLSRQQVLGSCPKSIKHRVLARLRPNKRFPILIMRDGHTVRVRLHFSPAPGCGGSLLPEGDSIYSHLPIYKGLKPRKLCRHKAFHAKGKNR